MKKRPRDYTVKELKALAKWWGAFNAHEEQKLIELLKLVKQKVGEPCIQLKN